VSAVAAGCNSLQENLLEAPDPDIIDPSQVQSAGGANAVRLGALSRLRSVAGGSESTWLFGGLLADEWSTSSTFVENDQADERQIALDNGSVTAQIRQIYRVRTAADQAIALLRKYRPTPASDIGEMYFARGFAELQLASDFCNGIPLSTVDGDSIALSSGFSVADVFGRAVASFDSAVASSSGTDNASVLVNTAAHIGKARAQLGLGKIVEAGATVTEITIPTNFSYDITYSNNGGTNQIYGQGFSARRYTVGDSVEGNARNLLVTNAIPFFSAHDPRVPASYTVSANGKDTTKSQDGLTFSRTTTLWGQVTPTPLVNGIDARLIEAEAALNAGNPTASNPTLMLSILNALRAQPQVVTKSSTSAAGSHPGVTTPAMAALVDPGTAKGQQDLLFREKAFWTFGRGQRLGDLRRLVRPPYNRLQDSVFPVGKDHYRGGSYGGDVNLPVPTAEKNGNPAFNTCTDRKA